MNKHTSEMLARLFSVGIAYEDALTLRRISMTLHRWGELECGDGNAHCSWGIERDEETGKPFMVTYPHNGPSRRHAIPDRERGALRRLAKLMERYPAFEAYHQTDPRGASLYIVPKAALGDSPIHEFYSSRGIAVYK